MPHSITIDGQYLPIILRKRRGTRRITMRYQPLKHAVSVTLPWHASMAQGLAFVEKQRSWLARQLTKKPERVAFADGQVIPFLGADYCLRHVGGRGVVAIEGDAILVPGDASFMSRRVREWIKTQAKAEITMLAGLHAQAIGQRFTRIILRDTSSSWGSCSKGGNLSFSWRLAFAPYEVLDYVVAHEIAHLSEHNHSAAFWKVVEGLCPEYEKLRGWLRTHGGELYRYG